jgi:hypothetical protein
MNKQLLNAAHDTWLKGYDVKVIFQLHDKVTKIAFGKKKPMVFKNAMKALSFLQAGLQFAEPDKALGAERRAEVDAPEPVEPADPAYEPVE